MINEAKTYTKEICKISDLGKDYQVIVEKGNKLIAQYMCHAGDCTCTPNTVGQLTRQSGYLVLTMQNISPLDRFNASHNRNLILRNFTLDEVLPTSATPDLTDEALNPSIIQTVPLTSTTPTLAEEANSQRHFQTGFSCTTVLLVALASGVLLLAVLALTIMCERAGQDKRWKVIAFPWERSCDSAPNQHDGNSIEMQSLADV